MDTCSLTQITSQRKSAKNSCKFSKFPFVEIVTRGCTRAGTPREGVMKRMEMMSRKGANFAAFFLVVWTFLARAQDNGTLWMEKTLTLAAILESEEEITAFLEGVRTQGPIRGNDVAVVSMVANNSNPMGTMVWACDEAVPRGPDAILFAGGHDTSLLSARYVMMVAKYLDIPVISAYRGMSGVVARQEELPNFVHLGVSVDQEYSALMSILKYFFLTRFSIITTLHTGHKAFIRYFQEQTEKEGDAWGVEGVLTLDLDSMEMMDLYMSLARDITSSIILLYCTKQEATVLLPAAEFVGKFMENSVWIVPEIVIGDLDSALSAPYEYPVGLLGIKYESPSYSTRKMTLDGLSVYRTAMEKYLAKGDVLDTFMSDTCWNYTTRTKSDSLSFKDFLQNASIPERDIQFGADGFVDSPNFAILNLASTGTWQRVGSIIMNRISLNGIIWPGNSYLPPRPVVQRHLKVVTIEEEPFVIVTDLHPVTGDCIKAALPCTKFDSHGQEEDKCCTGFCMDMLEQLKDDAWFTVEIYVVADGRHGTVQSGHWNGVIGDLINGTADMAVGSLTITEERLEAVDFSVPFIETGLKVLVAKKKGVVSPSAFLEPYDATLWIIIAVLIINVITCALWLFEKSRPGQAEHPQKDPSKRFAPFHALWLLWTLLFNNTMPLIRVPKGLASKFMVCVWAMFSTIFIASYTANLAAFMIQEQVSEKITGLTDPRFQRPEEFQPSFKFGSVVGTSMEMKIRDNYPRMYSYMQKFNTRSAKEAVEALKKRELDSFIYDAVVLEYLAGKDDGCNLVTVGNVFASTGYGVAFPKGSQWKSTIDLLILSYNDNGYLDMFKSQWVEGLCSRKQELEKNTHRLAIENCSGVFILLLAAIALSLVIFCLEHIVYKYLVFIGKWPILSDSEIPPSPVYENVQGTGSLRINGAERVVVTEHKVVAHVGDVFDDECPGCQVAQEQIHALSSQVRHGNEQLRKAFTRLGELEGDGSTNREVAPEVLNVHKLVNEDVTARVPEQPGAPMSLHDVVQQLTGGDGAEDEGSSHEYENSSQADSSCPETAKHTNED
ncbi:GRIN2A [Branchiostoma lanceolatum]|uniref:GRIN2A protein n=2 Tax=Branchiostoma lanceolatum TaxID=7740 RepID=A0A8K0F0Y9_BRALA|nr:GRIN2A [Branchiostoma lanceolatum]